MKWLERRVYKHASREASMQNSTRKTALLGVIVLLVLMALWAFGLLRGPAVVY